MAAVLATLSPPAWSVVKIARTGSRSTVHSAVNESSRPIISSRSLPGVSIVNFQQMFAGLACSWPRRHLLVLQHAAVNLV